MKILFPTSAMRHTAFLVLLVWLFAMGSGMVNACLLEARGSQSHVATASSSETAHAPVAFTDHEEAVVGHGHDSEPAKAPCLKVCDDESRSLLKQQSGVGPTELGPAPLVAILWTVTTSVASAPLRMDDRQPLAPELPLRVRYARLAL